MKFPLIGIIGTLTGITTLYFNYLSQNPSTTWQLNVISLIAVVTTILLGIYFYRNEKHKNYAKGYDFISKGFSCIRGIDEEDEDLDARHLEAMIKLCSEIKRAYEMFSGKNCSVCIKIITEHEGTHFTRTYCRDSDSQNEDERTHPSNDGRHEILKNTDFNEIFSNAVEHQKIKHYFCNNLPSLPNYKNTRFKEGFPPPIEPRNTYGAIKSYLLRQFQWPLPYKSTIVAPIIHMTGQVIDHEKLEGFICIDCKKRFAFNSKYDVAILRGIGDGITDAMHIANKDLKTS